MKKFILLFPILALILNLRAQSPSSFSYQAVVRTADNSLLISKPVSMRISILNGLGDNAELYIETHETMSNQNGLVSIKIGEGNSEFGSFTLIDWTRGGPFYVKTETDPNGGTDYVISGTSQLLSVPFSLHSNTAQNALVADSAGFAGTSNLADYSNFSGQAENAKNAEKSLFAQNANRAKLADGLVGGIPEQIKETHVYPQSAAAGRFLTVSFSGGTGVRFSGGSQLVALQYNQASSTSQQATSTHYQATSTHQQASTIYPLRVYPINDKKIDAVFRIPHTAASGLYDIIVSPNTSDRKVLNRSFNVYWY